MLDLIKSQLTIVKFCNDEHYNFISSLCIFAVIIAGLAEYCSPTAYGKFGTDAK
eukprot:Pgem_evm1s16934